MRMRVGPVPALLVAAILVLPGCGNNGPAGQPYVQCCCSRIGDIW
jgi:hypothetical protein